MDFITFLLRSLAIFIAMKQLQAGEKAKEQKVFRKMNISTYMVMFCEPFSSIPQ